MGETTSWGIRQYAEQTAMRVKGIHNDRIKISWIAGIKLDGKAFPDLVNDFVFYSVSFAGIDEPSQNISLYQG